MILRILFITLFLSFGSSILSAQTAGTSKSVSMYKKKKKKKKKNQLNLPTQFGIGISTVLPNNFVNSKEVLTQDTASSLVTGFNQKMGFQVGAMLQFKLNRYFGFEVGLMQIRRNYDVTINVPDSSILATKRLGFVAYDVPVNGVVKVKLTNNWSSSTQFGMSISHYPSDVRDSIISTEKRILLIEGRRINRTFFSLNFATGFEYTFENGGVLHIGGQIKLPIQPVFLGIGIVRKASTDNRIFTISNVNGGYFGVGLNYYFSNQKQRATKETPKAIIE